MLLDSVIQRKEREKIQYKDSERRSLQNKLYYGSLLGECQTKISIGCTPLLRRGNTKFSYRHLKKLFFGR